MTSRGFAFIPLIIVAAALLVAGTATVAIVKPQALSSIAQPITHIFSPTSPEPVATVSPAPSALAARYSAEGAAQTSTVLVHFKAGTSPSTVTAIHNSIGGKIKRTISGVGTAIVTLPANALVGDLIAKYKNHPEVDYAEPNFLAKSTYAPNDPSFTNQWDLQKINASAAWDSGKAATSPIAIVDTGIMATHPDLSGEVEAGYNFVADTTNTADDNGHGTHVAGTIAAITDNAIGVASIGFHGGLMPVKVLDANGSGTYGDIASGITYAVDHGAKVINLSLVGPSNSQTLQSAVTYAVNRGVFVVAAAGNDNSSAPEYPAACVGVLAVSATSNDDSRASFSSYGSDIFAAAPGVNILSTYNTGGYATMSGTSMAAPHLAGLLGLAEQYVATTHSNITSAQVLDDVKKSNDKIGAYAYDQNGWNQYYGYGRLNAGKLLSLLANGAITSPTVTPSATATPTSTPATVHAPTVFNFNVELEGAIDSVAVDNSKIRVKVTGISQSIALSAGNLVDVFLANQPTIIQQGQSQSIQSLASGEKVNIKALWSNNQLLAQQITIQGAVQPTVTATPIPISAPVGSGNGSSTNRSNSNANNSSPGSSGLGKGR